ILLRGVIVSSKWKELSPKPTKLRSLSFAAHCRLSRHRSPPPQMTKKKKLKSKFASGSPAGSASSNSSVSRSSAPLSSEIAVEVNTDPSDLGLPGAVTATGAATEDLSTVENGAVTATTSSAGAHENKNLEVIGAVTATDVTTEDLSPIESGVVSATISIGVDRNPNPEIEGAVTATIEEGEFVPPSSDTPATTTSVPVEKPLSSETEQTRMGLQKDKAPIASQVPIVDIPEPSRTGPPKDTGTAVKKHQGEAKSNADRTLRIQSKNGQAVSAAQKELLVVDFAGFNSPRNSAQGTDTEFDSGSDSISADEDNPPELTDRFTEVMNRKMKKQYF
ncbi:hypothetical protein HID58_041809, partial [Brassica napus]